MKKIFFGFLLLTGMFSESFSQNLSAPDIICVTTDFVTGNVTINWDNPTLNPCGPFERYVLYGATSATGPFFIVASITDPNQTSYVHVGANATILDWFYFMTTEHTCPGFTSDSSALFQEATLIPNSMDYVTVLPNGVEINWTVGASPQTVGYIIFEFNTVTGDAIAIDTVYGRNNTSYFHTSSSAQSGTIAYTVTPIDGCGNRAGMFAEFHRTIFLSATVQQCSPDASLSWNLYVNWPGISAYQIETSIDNAPFTVAQSLPDSSAGFNFTIPGLTGDTLCFRIKAVHQNGTTTSNSNVVCITPDIIRSTTFNYLRRVSVNSAGRVDIEWYIDSTADINSYRVRRSDDDNFFADVETLPVTAPVFLNNYTDASAQPDESSLSYRVVSLDDCNFERESTTGKTIFLSGTSQGGINQLRWTPYVLDNATVLDYTLFRFEQTGLVPVQTLPPTTLEYTDEITTSISDDGSFCYVVEAGYQLNITGLVNENLRSVSNTFCLYQPPVVYVPNAFVPGGKNNMFKPTLLNPNIAEYEFIIFDRWGKKLFETNLLNAGWDGTNKGEEMPMGGYAYYIKVVSLGGVAEEKKGMVVLVR